MGIERQGRTPRRRRQNGSFPKRRRAHNDGLSPPWRPVSRLRAFSWRTAGLDPGLPGDFPLALVAAGFGAPLPEEVPVVTAGVFCALGGSTGCDSATRFCRHPRPARGPGKSGGRRRRLARLVRRLTPPAAEAPGLVDHAAGVHYRRRHLRRAALCHGAIGPAAPGREADGFRSTFSNRKRATIEANFHKYGVRLLLGVRLLPGIRAPVFVMAGVVRLPLYRFPVGRWNLCHPRRQRALHVGVLVHGFGRPDRRQCRAARRSLKHYFVTIGIAAFAIWMLYEFWKRLGRDRRPEGSAVDRAKSDQAAARPGRHSSRCEDGRVARRRKEDRGDPSERPGATADTGRTAKELVVAIVPGRGRGSGRSLLGGVRIHETAQRKNSSVSRETRSRRSGARWIQRSLRRLRVAANWRIKTRRRRNRCGDRRALRRSPYESAADRASRAPAPNR